MHQRALELADLFKQNFKNPAKRIDSRLMKQKVQQEEENKEILRQIVLAVEFLAKQALPLRGHRDDKVDFTNKDINRGNFIAVLQLLAKRNDILRKHLQIAKQNAKYTSKTIQKEIVHIYAGKIKQRLTVELREKNLPFTIMADEVTDPYANQEILSVCLRFVDLSSPQNPHIKECLIAFMNLERANASTISQKKKESLTDKDVCLDPTNIRGQAFDGAAVMSSGIAGVQAKIKEVAPLAMYTHCYSHCLNLSIGAACKVQEVRNLIGVINESYLFLANSPKRQSFFELTVKAYLPESSHKKLPGLCKTRWVERHICFDVFLEMYETLVTFLDAIISPHEYPALIDQRWNWDRDTCVKAQGLKAALTSFQTLSVFVITKNVLDEAKVLASKLQKRDQDIYEAYKLVDKVIDCVKTTRSTIDNTFSLWYDEILQLAENIGTVESVPRKTSLQRNRSNTPSESPKEHYKRVVAIPLLDSLLNQMVERFSDEGRHASDLLCLVPSILLSSDIQPFDYLEGMLHWERDLPFPKSLRNEVIRWHALWERRHGELQQTEVCKSDIPDNLLLSLGACDADAFPNIHCLLVIACTLPITSAEVERSFSLFRRMKTYARSTMTEERLSDLAVIAMNYSDRIPVDEICHAFVQSHPRRLFQGSLFAD